MRLRLRARRGVRGRRRALDRRARRATGSPTATSRSPASRPTCTSASRPRACSPCASRSHGTAAHGSTPWLGDNAILKAHDVFRRIETLPFARESRDLFDRPVDQPRARSSAATRSTRCPTAARSTSTSATCPTRTPATILAQIRAIPDLDDRQGLHPRAGDRVAHATRTCCALREAVGRRVEGEALSVGRDGASDAVSFLEAGIPAVEFGPVGAGHHGPEEWVSVSSLDALPPGARRLRHAGCPRACARRAATRAARRRGATVAAP